MKKSVLFLIAAILLTATTAMATPFYFSYQNAHISGFVQLDAVNNGNGSFTALSGFSTAIFNGVDYGTLPLFVNPNSPNTATSPLGFFYYDNLLFSNGPLLDSGGLLFSNGNEELNIWGNGANPFSAWLGVKDFGYVSSNDDVTFTASAVPEAGTLVLFGVGLLCLTIYGKRRMNYQA